MPFFLAFFCPVEYNLSMAKSEKSIPDLLTDLDEHITKIGAIAQAAKDYVTIKEKVLPMPNNGNKHSDKITLAYNNLKELILS